MEKLTNDAAKKVRPVRSGLLKWFEKNRREFPWRKRGISGYQVLVTEILLQKTKAENVLAIYDDFFKKYTSFSKLSTANEKELADLLRPIGLHKSRSKSLVKLASLLGARKRLPRKEEELLKLPGVGLYVANAYLVVKHNLKRPIVDVNVTRLFSRIFSLRVNSDLRRDKDAWEFAACLLPAKRYKEFNWALLDFGALVCKAKNPKCPSCPLNKYCDFRSSVTG